MPRTGSTMEEAKLVFTITLIWTAALPRIAGTIRRKMRTNPVEPELTGPQADFFPAERAELFGDPFLAYQKFEGLKEKYAAELRHIIERELIPGAGIISIDGIDLKDFDFIDIGQELPDAKAVPVVIKSLIFRHSEHGRGHAHH